MHDFHLFLYAIIYHHQMMGENKKFFIFSSLTCHSSKISSFLHLGIFSIPPANNRKNSKMFPERVIRNIDYLIEILRIDSEILKFQKKKMNSSIFRFDSWSKYIDMGKNANVNKILPNYRYVLLKQRYFL